MTDDNVTQLPPPKKRPPGPGRGRKVKQGSGLPAMGKGWGGDAKGEGTKVPIGEHPENWGKVVEGQPELRKAKIADKQAAADRALAVLEDVMENSEIDMARISAANALLDRIEGKPVQRIVGGTVETVEEIRTRDPVAASEAYQRVMK